MSLQGIISISGMSGLYKVVAQAKNGFIVESITDKKRFPIASSQRISALKDISVFTTSDDKPLNEVLLAMKELNGGDHAIDAKRADNNALKTFFKQVLPDFDQGRVYVSDIKKIIVWYGLLKDIVGKEEEEVVVTEEITEKQAKKEKKTGVTEEKPKKAAVPKKEKAVTIDKPAKEKIGAKKPAAAKTKKKTDE